MEPDNNNISELEIRFSMVLQNHGDAIQAKIKEAYDALSKACALSEQFGLPFNSSISFLSQSYSPASYKLKFGGIEDFVEWTTGIYPGENGDSGWEPICY